MDRTFSEPDFREVCQNLYDGIHITDGEGVIVFINDAYTRTTGIRPEQVLGRRVSEIEGLLYQGSVTEQVLKTRQRVNSVATILALDKEVLVTGTPVFNPDGSIKLVVTNTRDFPELKRLEQQLSAMTEERNKYGQELAFLRRQQAGGKALLASRRFHPLEQAAPAFPLLAPGAVEVDAPLGCQAEAVR